LVSVGRNSLQLKGLRIRKAGVKVDDRGEVRSDGHLKNHVRETIYAIGDVLKGCNVGVIKRKKKVCSCKAHDGEHPHIDL